MGYDNSQAMGDAADKDSKDPKAGTEAVLVLEDSPPADLPAAANDAKHFKRSLSSDALNDTADRPGFKALQKMTGPPMDIE
eukprot:11000659-Alexandrium_andersonii.AAC.1